MNERKVYRPSDITPGFVQAVAMAASRWATSAAEYVAKHGDQGTCVLGAGIGVMFLAKRKRVAEELVLIPAPGGQGSLTWEASVEEVLGVLRSRGVDAFYMPGWMD